MTGDDAALAGRREGRDPIRYISPIPRTRRESSPVPRSTRRAQGRRGVVAESGRHGRFVLEPPHLASLTPEQRADLRLWAGRVNLLDRVKSYRRYALYTAAAWIGGTICFGFGVAELPPLVVGPIVPIVMTATLGASRGIVARSPGCACGACSSRAAHARVSPPRRCRRAGSCGSSRRARCSRARTARRSDAPPRSAPRSSQRGQEAVEGRPRAAARRRADGERARRARGASRHDAAPASTRSSIPSSPACSSRASPTRSAARTPPTSCARSRCSGASASRWSTSDGSASRSRVSSRTRARAREPAHRPAQAARVGARGRAQRRDERDPGSAGAVARHRRGAAGCGGGEGTGVSELVSW